MQVAAISGRIVDYLARPVEGAEVAIYETIHDFSTDRDVARLRDEIRRTDVNGQFVFPADVAPSYRVFIVARKEGLALGWDCPVFTHDNVIVLEKACGLSGIVVDAVGRPVVAAKVRAVPKSTYLMRLEQSPILAPESWLTVETDGRGRFHFKDFAADVSADFWVQAPGRAQVYECSTHWMTVCGYEAGRTDVRLVLPEEMVVRGQVVGARSGEPVADARILIHPDEFRHDHANPYLTDRTISGKDGWFTFNGVPPGKHYIDVAAPYDTGLVDQRVGFEVRRGQEAGEMVARLHTGGTIEIEAREQRTNEPIPGLAVCFWQAGEDNLSGFYKHAQTGVDGVLRVRAPAGLCEISAGLDGYVVPPRDGKASYTNRSCGAPIPLEYPGRVLVPAGQTVKSKVILRRCPEASGVALDENGQPVAGVSVNQAFADQAGQFKASIPSAENPFSGWVARSERSNFAALVNVQRDEEPIQITLKPALAVSGRVTEPNGAGIPAARVALHVIASGSLMPYAPEVVADSQGWYELKAVVPGRAGAEYRISIDVSGYGVRRYKKISIDGEPGTHVTLDPIVLHPAPESVTGIVVDAKGSPAPAVAISSRGADQPVRYAATDGNGRFVIRRVCKGALRIQAGFSRVREEYGLLQVEGGDRDVKVILGQDGVHPRPEPQSGKTAGKEK